MRITLKEAIEERKRLNEVPFEPVSYTEEEYQVAVEKTWAKGEQVYDESQLTEREEKILQTRSYERYQRELKLVGLYNTK